MLHERVAPITSSSVISLLHAMNCAADEVVGKSSVPISGSLCSFDFVIWVGRNVAGPPSHMRHPSTGNARSATQTATTYPGLSGVRAQRYRLLSSPPHGFRVGSREKSWLASSSQDTVEQESGKEHDGVDAEDAVEVEARPFPKVGDVVRYEGKWKDDLTFGEVNEAVASALFWSGFGRAYTSRSATH